MDITHVSIWTDLDCEPVSGSTPIVYALPHVLCVTIVVQWQMHQDINVAAVSSCGFIGSTISSPSLSSNEILYDATTKAKLDRIDLYSRGILCATVSKQERIDHAVLRNYESLPALSSNEILYDETTAVKLDSIGLHSRVILYATLAKQERTDHSVLRNYD